MFQLGRTVEASTLPARLVVVGVTVCQALVGGGRKVGVFPMCAHTLRNGAMASNCIPVAATTSGKMDLGNMVNIVVAAVSHQHGPSLSQKLPLRLPVGGDLIKIAGTWTMDMTP
jgi:hypothetical protein